MAVPGFTSLGGTSRRYIDNSTGEEISRREYNKRAGLASFEERKAQLQAQENYVNPMAKYNSLVNDYRQYQSKQIGIKPSSVKVRGNSSTAQKFAQIQQDLKSRDKSSTGATARALVELGRRELSWTFAVGETPNEGVR